MLDVDADNLSEITTVLELVLAKGGKVIAKDNGHIISAKEIMDMYRFVDSKVQIPVNADGKLEMTNPYLAVAQWNRISLRANALNKQAVPFLGEHDATAKRTIDGKLADPQSREFAEMKEKIRKLTPATMHHMQAQILEHALRAFKTAGVIAAADFRHDNCGTWLLSKLSIAITNRVYNSPSLLDDILASMSKPITNIAEINELFAQLEPALIQARIMENWLGTEVPIDIRKKIARAILAGASKLPKEHSQLQINIERIISEMQTTIENATVDMMKEGLKQSFHQSQQTVKRPSGENETQVVFHVQEERPSSFQRGRGRGRGGAPYQQRGGAANPVQRDIRNTQGTYPESLNKRVTANEKRLEEIAEMLKEALQNKKQRGNHVRAMHLHREFEGEEEESEEEGHLLGRKRGWVKAVGFTGMASVLAEETKFDHSSGKDNSRQDALRLQQSIGFALAASDDDDSEDCADPAIVAEGLPVYDGSDDNHDIYVEKGKGPVETYVTTDVDNVEAGATTDVRRSARVSMRPAMFKPEKPKSRTPRHSTSKKLKKPAVPGQDDISYPTSGQECTDSQSEEELAPENQISKNGSTTLMTPSGVPFKPLHYGNKSKCYIEGGVRIRKLERHLPDLLDAANSVHAIGEPPITASEARVTKVSIGVEVVDWRSEPEDDNSIAGVSNSVGSGGKVKPDASVPGGRHASQAGRDDDEDVPELAFSSSDEE